MNCKPGDLAIVVARSELIGRIVEVLYQAPKHDFNLPDGYRHDGADNRMGWVIKSCGAPFLAKTNVGITRIAMYGCIDDRKLRPIRGLPDTEDTNRKEPIKEST